jgi:predicted aspartyl protease
MNRLFAAAIVCVFVTGCGGAAKTRPIVHDQDGRVVSELIFPSDREEVVLPLRFDGSLLFADDVKINGQHVGSFVIDTGAMCSALDRGVAKKLGLMNGKRLRDRTDSKLRRPDGLFHIDSLDIGGVGVRNHVIAVLDLSSVRARGRPNLAGVIGADVWAMMPFTVDYRAKEVVFHARPHFREPTRDRAAASSLLNLRRELRAPSPFSLANPRAGTPSVAVKVNGETTDALLDTASGSSIVLMPRFVNRHPTFVRGDRAVARAAGAGGGVGVAGYGLVGANIESIDALGVRFTDVRGGLAIIDDVAREQSSAILGTRILSRLRLTFDYASGKVWAEVK